MPLKETLVDPDGSKPPFILGVDEAGRGPVLGPMVYACVYAPLSKKSQIKAIGVDDSKKLTEDDRDKLFTKMMTTEYKDWIGFAVTSISPRDISEGMLRRTKYNLNQQAYDTTIALIRETLNQGVNVTEIYVDTVGKEKPYQAVLEKEFPGINITVTTKADSKFPIVSAASIFAKVIRDCVVKNWVFSEPGIPEKPFSRVFGSGYPGDPNTKKWLRQNLDPIFGFPDMIRFSWSTAAKLCETSCAPVTWPDDEPADKMQNGNIGNYFKKVETSKPLAAKLTKASSSSARESDENDEEEDGTDEEAATKGKAGVKRKRAGPVVVADDDDDDEGAGFVFNKGDATTRREKTLALDTSRDALVFRGLSFRHVTVL
ncbi:Ribonuclease H2 subunit A [Rhizoclosmatium hyalinum]|nr:Ribonuclease H2 subunit A [Rhizoclosmatium hyalinum]